MAEMKTWLHDDLAQLYRIQPKESEDLPVQLLADVNGVNDDLYQVRANIPTQHWGDVQLEIQLPRGYPFEVPVVRFVDNPGSQAVRGQHVLMQLTTRLFHTDTAKEIWAPSFSLIHFVAQLAYLIDDHKPN